MAPPRTDVSYCSACSDSRFTLWHLRYEPVLLLFAWPVSIDSHATCALFAELSASFRAVIMSADPVDRRLCSSPCVLCLLSSADQGTWILVIGFILGIPIGMWEMRPVKQSSQLLLTQPGEEVRTHNTSQAGSFACEPQKA